MTLDMAWLGDGDFVCRQKMKNEEKCVQFCNPDSALDPGNSVVIRDCGEL